MGLIPIIRIPCPKCKTLLDFYIAIDKSETQKCSMCGTPMTVKAELKIIIS